MRAAWLLAVRRFAYFGFETETQSRLFTLHLYLWPSWPKLSWPWPLLAQQQIFIPDVWNDSTFQTRPSLFSGRVLTSDISGKLYVKLAIQVSKISETSNREPKMQSVIYCPLSPSSFVDNSKHVTWAIKWFAGRKLYK